MMEYKVIQENSVSDLEQKVNQYLKENWQLQGGVSVAYSSFYGGSKIFYAQALIKI